MALKKDKQKVLGEFFDNERIQSFLQYEAENTAHADFHLLEKAYRGMIAENFATFVQFFLDAGKDINGTNQYGKTFLQTINTHRQAQEYTQILTQSGAE